MVDDYHLEILRGTDLMGRWYLADVEVKREIAERFTLFLGDDEMEFLADDALVFAYEGVTRMQQGWVNAKKRKRRHRRAAADAARRKDEAPVESAPMPVKVDEPPRPQAPKKVPTSDLAKKLAAIASAEAAANEESDKRRLTWAEAEALELAQSAKTEPPPPAKKPRKRAAPKEEPAAPPFTEPVPSGPLFTEPSSPPPAPPRKPRRVEPAPVAPSVVAPPASEAPDVAPPKRKRTPKPPIEATPIEPTPIEPTPIEATPIEATPIEATPIEATPIEATPSEEPPLGEPAETEYPEPAWIAPPPPARLVTVDLSVEEPVVIETPLAGEEPPAAPIPPEIEDESSDELTKRRQRRKSRREAVADVQVPDQETEARQITNIEAARGKVKEPKGAGHHPAETNVGLLAKLRRPPKADQEHIHTYEESRSAGGLTRRVCVECNHVSITSDD
ncbi:MAG TPA: hypothetical protein VFZ06_04975 [Acidimicrobiia bacterium]|nr:hypothetical protein [Acidimicrobiia bacterium]